MELISREDAIKCLDGNVLITEQKEAEAVKEYFEMVIARLKALPTIEERKEGRWLDHRDEGYVECPFCGSCTTCEDNIDELHFCFNCGNKLKGE